jgi:hypothetical protein
MRRDQRPQQGVVAVRRFCLAQRRLVNHPQCHLEEAVSNLYCLRLDGSFDGLLRADQDADDSTLLVTQRLQPPPARELELLALRPLQKIAQGNVDQVDAALLHLLPVVERLVVDPQRLDQPVRRLPAVRPFGQRRSQLSDHPFGQVQEADGHSQTRFGSTVDQAFRLVACGVAAALGTAERLGIQAAKGPALPVLDGRPIGVKDVPLVQDCAHQVVHEAPVHVAATASLASRASSACSEVASPCRL